MAPSLTTQSSIPLCLRALDNFPERRLYSRPPYGLLMRWRNHRPAALHGADETRLLLQAREICCDGRLIL